MNRQIKQRALCIALTSHMLLGTLQQASAEGGGRQWLGAFGVNRVIRTNQHYSAVGGSVDLEFTMPVNASGTVTQATNPYNNKPSAYLGGDGTTTRAIQIIRLINTPQQRTDSIPAGRELETDAGLQFETGVWNNFPVGWAAFISLDGTYVNPRIWIANPVHPDGGTSEAWRGGGWTRGASSIDADLAFNVENGWIRLTVGGTTPALGSFFWNQDPAVAQAGTDANGVFHQTAPYQSYQVFTAQGITGKRVVAMTRRGGPNEPNPAYSELDGSTLECTFSNSWLGTPQNGWPAGVVDQAATGYDAPGNGTATIIAEVPLRAWDGRQPWDLNAAIPAGGRATTARTIVEFTGQGVDNFAYRAGGSNQGAAGRYENETVRINLRTGTRPVGNSVEW